MISKLFSSIGNGIRETIRTKARRRKNESEEETSGMLRWGEGGRGPQPQTSRKLRENSWVLSPQQCLSYTPSFHSVRVAGLRSASDQWGEPGLEKS